MTGGVINPFQWWPMVAKSAWVLEHIWCTARTGHQCLRSSHSISRRFSCRSWAGGFWTIDMDVGLAAPGQEVGVSVKIRCLRPLGAKKKCCRCRSLKGNCDPVSFFSGFPYGSGVLLTFQAHWSHGWRRLRRLRSGELGRNLLGEGGWRVCMGGGGSCPCHW